MFMGLPSWVLTCEMRLLPLRLRTSIGADPSGARRVSISRFCTPSWLHQECARDGYVLGRHHLTVLSYDFEVIRRTLTKFVDRCSGATWQEVAGKVTRM